MTAPAPVYQTLPIEVALQQAVAHHQAGRLQEAEQLYRAILQAQPNHPEANHNLGAIAVQVGQPAAGLPHLKVALEANPNQGQYWLSYIDTLIQTGQTAAARQVLEQGRQQGLRGEAVDALAVRLDEGARATEQSNADNRHSLKGSALEKDPGLQEINTLMDLFTRGRYTEAATLAQTLTQRFPQHGLSWKVLGATFKQMGRNAEALDSMQRAAVLSPGDPQAHNNLAAILKDLGRLEEAAASCRWALKIKPDFADAHYNLGIILKDLDRLEEAEASYRRVLEIKPDYAEAHYNRGIILKDLGRLEEAEASYQRALEIKPDYAEAHNNLGGTLLELGQPNEAETSCRRAIQIKPDYAEAHSNLGGALQKLGRLDEAETSYRRAIEIKPDYAEAHSNLGGVLHELGQLNEAEASYRRALEIKPAYAEAYNYRGIVLQDLGQLKEAEALYRRAIQIKPDYPEAYSNLGGVLQDLGRLNEAEANYRRALEIKPDYAEAHSNLGGALHELGRLEEAETSCRRAIQIKPDYAEAHCNLGNTLDELGRLGEAEASYRRALESKPDYAEAHCNLGKTLYDLGRLSEAEAGNRRALEIKPDYAEAHCNLGLTLQDLYRLNEAEACYRRAIEIKPDFAGAHSNLLYCLSHSETVDAQTLLAEHCRFGEKFESPLRAIWPRHANSKDPERLLQVGFVSADLRNHSVTTFIDPVLAHLARYPQLSLHTYYNYATETPATQRLRGYMKHWHPIAGLSDLELAQKVRADGIDILIDLSGHTAKNRLLAFARKPAPVQVSCIGYPCTTGLSAMDYYLADRFFLPPGQFDHHYAEKLAYLPTATPFLPNKDAPPVNPLPALSNGYMTFGSFNRPNKISRPVIARWSQLLRALPNARMVLGSIMPEADEDNTLIEWFSQEGIARERLSFHPRCSMKEYLGHHHQVDLCLDAFPYNGSTTSAHALWMGVPTLTLAGETVPSRAGVGWLNQFGLEVFAAHNKTEFVEKGVYWADNLAELAKIREGLRTRFGQSKIGQPAVIAAAFERALRIMWQRWCAGLPAESFEVPQQDIGNAEQRASYFQNVE